MSDSESIMFHPEDTKSNGKAGNESPNAADVNNLSIGSSMQFVEEPSQRGQSVTSRGLGKRSPSRIFDASVTGAGAGGASTTKIIQLNNASFGTSVDNESIQFTAMSPPATGGGGPAPNTVAVPVSDSGRGAVSPSRSSADAAPLPLRRLPSTFSETNSSIAFVELPGPTKSTVPTIDVTSPNNASLKLLDLSSTSAGMVPKKSFVSNRLQGATGATMVASIAKDAAKKAKAVTAQQKAQSILEAQQQSRNSHLNAVLATKGSPTLDKKAGGGGVLASGVLSARPKRNFGGGSSSGGSDSGKKNTKGKSAARKQSSSGSSDDAAGNRGGKPAVREETCAADDNGEAVGNTSINADNRISLIDFMKESETDPTVAQSNTKGAKAPVGPKRKMPLPPGAGNGGFATTTVLTEKGYLKTVKKKSPLPAATDSIPKPSQRKSPIQQLLDDGDLEDGADQAKAKAALEAIMGDSSTSSDGPKKAKPATSDALRKAMKADEEGGPTKKISHNSGTKDIRLLPKRKPYSVEMDSSDDEGHAKEEDGETQSVARRFLDQVGSSSQRGGVHPPLQRQSAQQRHLQEVAAAANSAEVEEARKDIAPRIPKDRLIRDHLEDQVTNNEQYTSVREVRRRSGSRRRVTGEEAHGSARQAGVEAEGEDGSSHSSDTSYSSGEEQPLPVPVTLISRPTATGGATAHKLGTPVRGSPASARTSPSKALKPSFQQPTRRPSHVEQKTAAPTEATTDLPSEEVALASTNPYKTDAQQRAGRVTPATTYTSKSGKGKPAAPTVKQIEAPHGPSVAGPSALVQSQQEFTAQIIAFNQIQQRELQRLAERVSAATRTEAVPMNNAAGAEVTARPVDRPEIKRAAPPVQEQPIVYDKVLKAYHHVEAYRGSGTEDGTPVNKRRGLRRSPDMFSPPPPQQQFTATSPFGTAQQQQPQQYGHQNDTSRQYAHQHDSLRQAATEKAANRHVSPPKPQLYRNVVPHTYDSQFKRELAAPPLVDLRGVGGTSNPKTRSSSGGSSKPGSRTTSPPLGKLSPAAAAALLANAARLRNGALAWDYSYQPKPQHLGGTVAEAAAVYDRMQKPLTFDRSPQRLSRGPQQSRRPVAAHPTTTTFNIYDSEGSSETGERQVHIVAARPSTANRNPQNGAKEAEAQKRHGSGGHTKSRGYSADFAQRTGYNGPANSGPGTTQPSKVDNDGPSGTTPHFAQQHRQPSAKDQYHQDRRSNTKQVTLDPVDRSALNVTRKVFGVHVWSADEQAAEAAEALRRKQSKKAMREGSSERGSASNPSEAAEAPPVASDFKPIYFFTQGGTRLTSSQSSLFEKQLRTIKEIITQLCEQRMGMGKLRLPDLEEEVCQMLLRDGGLPESLVLSDFNANSAVGSKGPDDWRVRRLRPGLVSESGAAATRGPAVVNCPEERTTVRRTAVLRSIFTLLLKSFSEESLGGGSTIMSNSIGRSTSVASTDVLAIKARSKGKSATDNNSDQPQPLFASSPPTNSAAATTGRTLTTNQLGKLIPFLIAEADCATEDVKGVALSGQIRKQKQSDFGTGKENAKTKVLYVKDPSVAQSTLHASPRPRRPSVGYEYVFPSQTQAGLHSVLPLKPKSLNTQQTLSATDTPEAAANPYKAYGCRSRAQFRLLCDFAGGVLLPILLKDRYRCYNRWDFATFARVLLESDELSSGAAAMNGLSPSAAQSANLYDEYFRALSPTTSVPMAA